MISVLISIKPKWCELIASGKKTVEVRKTKPKIDTPFKVYIYCTYGEGLIEAADEVLPNHLIGLRVSKSKTWDNCCNGKVIGEFVCDNITKFSFDEKYDNLTLAGMSWESCLTKDEIADYANGQYMIYGWHISDLVIYDKPKELSEFFHYCGDNPKCDGCEAHYYSSTECGTEDYCCSVVGGCKPLKRPPQSWCYVERGDE